MNTSLIVAAMSLCAMSAPVLAQYDPSLPQNDPTRAGFQPPPVYMTTLPDPTGAPPMFYSSSTPYGQALSTTTQTGGTTVTHTYGPGGTITTCFVSRSSAGGMPFVNCF